MQPRRIVVWECLLRSRCFFPESSIRLRVLKYLLDGSSGGASVTAFLPSERPFPVKKKQVVGGTTYCCCCTLLQVVCVRWRCRVVCGRSSRRFFHLSRWQSRRRAVLRYNSAFACYGTAQHSSSTAVAAVTCVAIACLPIGISRFALHTSISGGIYILLLIDILSPHLSLPLPVGHTQTFTFQAHTTHADRA